MTLHRLICAGLSLAVVLSAATLSMAQQLVANANWSSDVFQVPADSETGKSPVVSGISIQPRGHLVAVVGDDHLIHILDRSTGRFLEALEGHDDWVRSARFSPDGSLLATAGNDRRILLWNSRDFSRPRPLATHDAAIAALAFSWDGRHLAAAGFENRIRIYSVESGLLVREIEINEDDVRTAAFSPDDRWLAVAGRNGTIELIDTATWSVTATHPAHSRRVRELVFLASNRIASCSDEQHVRILDLDVAGESRDLPRHGGKLFAMCRLGEDLPATAGSDNTVYIWNPETGELVRKLAGHMGTISCLDSRDGLLVSGSYDTRIRFWLTEKVARVDDSSTIR